MSSNISINNFSEGMMPDIDKSIRSKNSYLSAENVRYLAKKYNNTGTLHSVESSNVVDAVGLINTDYIIGHQVIRDYLVLFTTRHISVDNRLDRIILYTIEETILNHVSELWSGTNLYKDTSSSETDLPEYLSTVGRYEDVDNIKVYWASSSRSIRMINIMDTISSYDQTRFNLVTSFDIGSPKLDSIVSGTLYSGRVDYAYSLIKENNQESIISGNLDKSKINLFSDNIEQFSTVNIDGDDVAVETGKGVKLIINISSDDYDYFDKIRLYRIHYKEYGQLPEITIVDDFSIVNTGDNSLIDTGGTGLGEYTAEEFSIINSVPYSAYVIKEKDNVLFAANVSEEVFDVDFDARAYRFDVSGVSRLYEEYGSYSTPEYSITSLNLDSVDSTANCINPFNDLDNDTNTSYRYMYRPNGYTEGGEGPEIYYGFSVTAGGVNIESTGTSSSAITYNGDDDYSDPTVVYSYTTFQRNEIYRYGIVFYNENGDKTSVKWIGDIRIPGPEAYTTSFQQYLVNSGSAYTMSIVFSLKNGLPTGVAGFEIVRVDRTENDKSILYAGYISSTIDVALSAYGGTDYTSKPIAPCVDSSPPYNLDQSTAGTAYNDTIITFTSPEISFFENVNAKAGDWIDIVGELTRYVNVAQSGGTYPDYTGTYNAMKYKTVTFRDSALKIDRYSIENLQYQTGIESVVNYGFSDAANGTLYNSCLARIGIPGDSGSPTGRTLYIQLDSALDRASVFSQFDIPYAYIKRNNTERYGGSNYQSRLRNKYISASEISNGTLVISKKGDTYINYFDYMDTMYSTEFSSAFGNAWANGECAGFVTFPCESKININLRHDDHFAKVSANPKSYLLKEVAGVHAEGTDEFTQNTDMYLYNSVYSQEQNINYSFPESDFDLRTEFDSRVVHSDKKFDDEYIDSWSKFRTNNFLDVESKHGPIKSLTKHNNVLYFCQDNAFGALSVNQRSLINDNNTGQLSLGSGDTLERFDYINEFYGTQHKKSINTNKGGIFFFDKVKKAIVKFNSDSLEVLSDSKGFVSFFDSSTLSDIPIIESNDINSEVYLKIDDSNILVFNNFTNTFISNYTFSPDYIADIEKFTIHKNDSDTGNIRGLYLGNDYGNFGKFSAAYDDSKIKILNNENFLDTKVYDSLNFFTNVKYNDDEKNTEMFDSVSFWNDYQYTGDSFLVLGTTLERRERGYSTYIPRNIVNANGTTNIDIFSPSNHDSSRLFRERMCDKYIIAELVYENSTARGQLSVPYVGFKYRKSIR